MKNKKEKYIIPGVAFPVKKSIIINSLTNIYAENKTLTPKIVLEEARNKSHPLHPCFEWSNKKAAEAYRLTQASKLIQCVFVEKQVDGKNIPVRAFINIRTDEKGHLSTNPFAKGTSSYVSINEAMTDDYLKKYTVDIALRDLEYLIDKYNNLQALSSLFNTIRKKIKQIRKKVA